MLEGSDRGHALDDDLKIFGGESMSLGSPDVRVWQPSIGSNHVHLVLAGAKGDEAARLVERYAARAGQAWHGSEKVARVL